MDQDLLTETKAILSIIYRDYVCDEDRKKALLKIQQDFIKNDFSKSKISKLEEIDKEPQKNQELVKEERWYKKIKDRIKGVLIHFIGGEKR